MNQCLVLVRGSGDIGSAVAHALFRARYPTLIQDQPRPAATRRGMGFTDALFDGSTWLAGVEGRRLDAIEPLIDVLREQSFVPVTALDVSLLLARLRPTILVDARMRKRRIPEDQRHLAPLTIGLGPNFVAGGQVHLAVETGWGEDLGRLIELGPTCAFAGEPRPIGGHARERYLYAPVAGLFETDHAIGDAVEQGQPVARIGESVLRAPLSGRLRGLTHDRVMVERGSKIIEVDPRGDHAVVTGIGERPGRIAQGVLAAVALHASKLMDPPACRD